MNDKNITPRSFFLRVMDAKVLLVAILMLSVGFSGCFGKIIPTIQQDEPIISTGKFVTGSDGLPVDIPMLPLNFTFSDVGEDGAEPSIGVTSSGCIFFIAFEKVMRSCDYGESWGSQYKASKSPTSVVSC